MSGRKQEKNRVLSLRSESTLHPQTEHVLRAPTMPNNKRTTTTDKTKTNPQTETKTTDTNKGRNRQSTTQQENNQLHTQYVRFDQPR